MNKAYVTLILFAVVIITIAGVYFAMTQKVPKTIEDRVTLNSDSQNKQDQQQKQEEINNQDDQKDQNQNNQNNQNTSCMLNLRVGGGEFSPETCEFASTIPGTPCGPNEACPKEYSVSMKDGNKSHIREVIVFNFKYPSSIINRFDPPAGLSEFNGQLIDKSFTAKNLLKGEVLVEPITTNMVKVFFDLYFANNISIIGSGTMPVGHYAAP